MFAFDSPIFGKTRHASEEERDQITKAVDETPVTVFQKIRNSTSAACVFRSWQRRKCSDAERHKSPACRLRRVRLTARLEMQTEKV